MNPEIVRVGDRGLFDQAQKLLLWSDYNRADGCCQRIEAALLELRTLGKQLGVMNYYFDRVMKP